ncbi:hypothetical protein ACFVYJ_04435 [Pontibacter sp. JAM-7]|uniref:hypothetical protein n=1 Tax=Pontibacter sp. JAM-7 TaxID=3366581 RepID=UPI003AF8BA56
MEKQTFWHRFRVVVLLAILLVVSLNSWLSRSRSTDWQETLWVVIYPINADQRQDTRAYLNALQPEHFADIEQFLSREGQRYGLTLTRPLEIHLAEVVDNEPPTVPDNASILDSVLWSLQFRYWAWRNDGWDGPPPDIRIFLRMFSPQNRQVLEHSLGLQKGMIGLVNGFASVDYQSLNSFVTLHEILHTLGASDKYDMTTLQPQWPDGYADPYQDPLLPQYRAEIMGGRIPQNASFSLIPESLDEVLIGVKTADEINWLNP